MVVTCPSVIKRRRKGDGFPEVCKKNDQKVFWDRPLKQVDIQILGVSQKGELQNHPINW